MYQALRFYKLPIKFSMVMFYISSLGCEIPSVLQSSDGLRAGSWHFGLDHGSNGYLTACSSAWEAVLSYHSSLDAQAHIFPLPNNNNNNKIYCITAVTCISSMRTVDFIK